MRKAITLLFGLSMASSLFADWSAPWSVETRRDYITEEISAYASSPRATPKKKMSFPYSDVYSKLGVGCDSKSEWVYFFFSEAPILIDEETRDGYSVTSTRLKWDDNVQKTSFALTLGDKFLNFIDDLSAVENILASNTALLELQLYGNGDTYFEYSLPGSAKAIAEIRAICSKAMQ